MVKANVLPALFQWLRSRNSGVQVEVLRTLQVLAECPLATRRMMEPDLIKGLTTQVTKQKKKDVACEAFRLVHAIARCGNVYDLLVEADFHEHVRKQLKNKDLRIQKEAFGALERMCMDTAATNALQAADSDHLLKVCFDVAKKTDNTEVEKGCLLLIARLCTNELMAMKIADGAKFAFVVKTARDIIPFRKVCGALALANLGTHKELRIKLVKVRALQLFVEMGKIDGKRADQAEYPRVAALGISNLSANYMLREVAHQVGALDVVIAMMQSDSTEVRISAANAASELTLHEENGRRLAMGGVFPPLLAMAKSGDPVMESASIKAISNLCMSEENQKTLMQEGGKQALQYLGNSRNTAVQKLAKKLDVRVKMVKLRAAARMAGKIAAAKAELGADGGDDIDGDDADDADQ